MITVILTTYNRPHHLRASLLALSRQVQKPDEIIVADDGSDEPTRDVISNFTSMFKIPVVHVWQPHHGFRAARSRNNAIRCAKGGIIAFLDQDGLAHSDWLAHHIIACKQNSFTVGALMMMDEKTTKSLDEQQIITGRFENLHSSDEKKRIASLHFRSRCYAFMRRFGLGVKTKPKLNSGNFAISRAILEQVNGFDANFEGWGQEDDDLGRRLYLAGIRPVSVIDCARVTHLWHPKDPSAPGRWEEGSNIQYFKRKAVKSRCDNGLIRLGIQEEDVKITRYGSP